MINSTLLRIAIYIILLIVIVKVLKYKFNIDTDDINVSRFAKKIYRFCHLKIRAYKSGYAPSVINRRTGQKSLVLIDSGLNKSTVLATLRQITGIDYKLAKQIVDSAPSTFMVNTSEKEANLTKEALEFVGAKIDIK